MAPLPTFTASSIRQLICKENCSHYIVHSLLQNLGVVWTIFVTEFWKTDQVVTFGILRNTDFKYLSHCNSHVLDCSHAKYTIRQEQSFSQRFITISASQWILSNFFQNHCNITDGTLWGWEEGGMGGGSGQEAGGGLNLSLGLFGLVMGPTNASHRPKQG